MSDPATEEGGRTPASGQERGSTPKAARTDTAGPEGSRRARSAWWRLWWRLWRRPGASTISTEILSFDSPTDRLAAVLFGSVDFALHTGIEPGPDEFEPLHPRGRVVLAAYEVAALRLVVGFSLRFVGAMSMISSTSSWILSRASANASFPSGVIS
jgi:hypothetical protein